MKPAGMFSRLFFALMSKKDRIWTEADQKTARSEGWELAYVVNDGKALQTAYLDVFDVGPTFTNRSQALGFVMRRAQERSKLHLHALSACSASRMSAAQSQPTGRRKR